MLWIILLTFAIIYIRRLQERRNPSPYDGRRGREAASCSCAMERYGCGEWGQT
jgi:hypothetical protein